jgi:acetylornithine deacetylase/succinyl-diaminopimelate desuccinylase-like protein
VGLELTSTIPEVSRGIRTGSSLSHAVSPAAANTYAANHKVRFIRELQQFIQFPSVSAQRKHAEDVKACAAWLAAHLRSIGFGDVRVTPTRGHPIVTARWHGAAGKPTLLVYGHYDVQPPEPLGEWKSSPFRAILRDGCVYGRGASDDKGQMFVHVKAIESWLRSSGKLPVNVLCIFEGEEEVGSTNFVDFINDHDRLAADAGVASDMPMLGKGQPALTYSMRGSLAFELQITGPRRDLHSGLFGGIVHNPIQALCEIIAKLHDANGRVTIPAHYDQVQDQSESERAFMAAEGPSAESIRRDATIERDWGERGFTAYERATIRPALTINGISGGYEGEGAKAVIPALATAKLSFRLASSQDPDQVYRQLRSHLARITPGDVHARIRRLSASKPVVIRRDHPAMRAAAAAYRKGFGASPVFVRSGGSIGVVDILQRVLGTPMVLMGFALPDDQMHSPNERFRLANFFQGITTSIWFLAYLSYIHSENLQLDNEAEPVAVAGREIQRW